MTAAGLWRSGIRAPRVPAGDIVVVGDHAARSMVVCAKAIEAVNGRLRDWPVACLWGIAVAFIGVPILIAVVSLCARSPGTRIIAVALAADQKTGS
jgi:hypothetical protein